MTGPSSSQVDQARAVVRWYLATHFKTAAEPGLPSMYADPAQLGALAVDLEALREGEPAALFRVLVVTAMFQRLKDTYVKRILRRIPPDRAAELTDEHWLRSRAAGSGCPASGSTELLRTVCDLSKTADGQSGICSVGQGRACFLHQHTVLLRRYSHFGKVPTSIALAIREAGAAHIGELHALAIEGRSPDQAALWLEAALTRAWRVSDKIAAMFLSLVCNPDLGSGAPWSAGVDWTHFVVIDVNVDHYLRATGYSGPWTYRARRAFIRDLAFAIRLDDLDSSLQRTNPRLVQQALYLFMSSSNRRELPVDCLHRQGACRECRPELAQICPVRASS